MTIRLYVGPVPPIGTDWALPDGAARHAQVRRMQPGDALRVFDGRGGEWAAEVTAMGRQEVRARVLEPVPPTPELAVAVTLAVGMPANERMDALVEKATELGVTMIQPLECERSVLRLRGERAERRAAHWQAVAIAACEQCGRATVPRIAAVQTFGSWLSALGPTSPGSTRWLLSPLPDVGALDGACITGANLQVLSGPEGGLTRSEEQAAVASGFTAVSLGPRVLRADTAPMALMAWVSLKS